MATAQFERDLRSAAHDAKRSKDHKSKWSRGVRHGPGVNRVSIFSDELTGSESQKAKLRPEAYHHSHRAPTANFVKGRHWDDVAGSNQRSKLSAREEISDPALSRSLIDCLPSSASHRKQSVSDNFLYNFDRADSPGKPLSLEIFVKTNPKETEKFVEREYEILDSNGDALKGRKARTNLRQKSSMSPSLEPQIVDDDGFELV